jgi:hypothetical protein
VGLIYYGIDSPMSYNKGRCCEREGYNVEEHDYREGFGIKLLEEDRETEENVGSYGSIIDSRRNKREIGIQ